MIRARIRVDGRWRGVCRRFGGANGGLPMGAVGQDEDRGSGKRRSRTRVARVGGDVQLA